MSHEPSVFKGALPYGNNLPRMIQRGVDTALDISWFYGDSVVSADLTAANVTLKQGSRVIVDNATPIFPFSGGSAYYVLPAAVTADLPFSDTMLEIWTFSAVISGEPVTVTVRKSGHLVRTMLQAMVNDRDLENRHARLQDIRPPAETDFQRYRVLAWGVLMRDLIKRGRRPELILDSYALIDLHVYKSLELIFRDAITFVGDGRYNDFADMYAEKYREEWENVVFRYDRSEDDAIQDGELEAAAPSIWLGEPPPGWPSLWTRGN